MANRITRRGDTPDDRRVSTRLPIERDVRCKVLERKKTVTQVGLGKVLNMSSTGALFTTENALPEGERVELSISWPAHLNDVTPLKLVLLGRVVRTDDKQAAISIEHYEFRTLGSAGL